MVVRTSSLLQIPYSLRVSYTQQTFYSDVDCLMVLAEQKSFG